MVICLVVGFLFWIIKLFHVVILMCKAFQIRSFFLNVLHIYDVSIVIFHPVISFNLKPAGLPGRFFWGCFTGGEFIEKATRY